MDYEDRKRPGIIIQARMTSSRCQNKNLAKVKGKPVIDWVIEACLKTNYDICIAIPDTIPNDALEVYLDLKWMGINRHRLMTVYRGFEEDVLARFMGANLLMNFDPIIRVCSDAIFLAPEDIELALNIFESRKYFTKINHVDVFSQAELEYADKHDPHIKSREDVLGTFGMDTVDYPEDIKRFNFDNDDPTIQGRLRLWNKKKKNL